MNFYTVCSLFYSLLLNGVYFSKKRLKTIENKIFERIMVTNLIGVLLALGSYYTILNENKFPILNIVVSKGYIIYLLTWLTLFTLYIFSITSKNIEKELSKIKKIFMVLYIIFSIGIVMSPLYYHNNNGAIYSYGPSANVMFIVSGLYICVWVVRLLGNYNELKDKCLVINNFIDTKDIISKSHEKIDFKKNKNKKLFVFVGRLDDSSKKLKRAINLVKEISSIELLIVGDGPDRKMYEDFTKKCKVENRVTFVGSKENPYPYMNEADYVILTSDYEGFPVTYLEAITLNKNIITTIETSDESIDMKDIAYIIPKKENEMVEKVKDILKEKNTKKSINIDKIQKNKIKIFEELFDN